MSKVEPLRLPTPEEAVVNRRSTLTQDLYDIVRRGGDSLKLLPSVLRRALAEEAWKERRTPNGAPVACGSFAEWVAAPFPKGIEASFDILHRLLADDMEARNLLDAAAQRGPGNMTGHNQHSGAEDAGGNVDNIHGSLPEKPTGTSIDAGLRRLRKAAEGKVDAETGEVLVEPDERAAALLRQVLAGEISVHAACVEMGWRRKTITVADDGQALADKALSRWNALSVIRRSLGKCTHEEIALVRSWCDGLLNGEDGDALFDRTPAGRA